MVLFIFSINTIMNSFQDIESIVSQSDEKTLKFVRLCSKNKYFSCTYMKCFKVNLKRCDNLFRGKKLE